MTADNKATLYDRIAKVTEAIGSFPNSIPVIDSATLSSNHVRLYIHRDYTSSRSPEFRKLAQLAYSFSAAINIERRDYTSGRQIRIEFERLGVRFKCINDIDTPAARTLVKAINRKLTSEPVVLSVTEFLQAVEAGEAQR